MSEEEYEGPLPGVSSLNRPYWEGLTNHQLKLPRCHGCETVWYPPTPWCPVCHARDFDWQLLSGKGTVNSIAEIHISGLPGYRENVPYNVVEVTLDEGPRILSNLIDIDTQDIQIGMAVEVVFDDVEEDLTLARFRPVDEDSERA